MKKYLSLIIIAAVMLAYPLSSEAATKKGRSSNLTGWQYYQLDPIADGNESQASAINNNRLVVGRVAGGSSFYSHGMLWDPIQSSTTIFYPAIEGSETLTRFITDKFIVGWEHKGGPHIATFYQFITEDGHLEGPRQEIFVTNVPSELYFPVAANSNGDLLIDIPPYGTYYYNIFDGSHYRLTNLFSSNVVTVSGKGLNNQGKIIGTYGTDSFEFRSFVYDMRTNTYTDFNASEINFAAINDEGAVAGTDGLTGEAFIYRNGVFTDIPSPTGAQIMFPSDINESNQVVGSYIDLNGNSKGFYFDGLNTLDADTILNNPNLSIVRLNSINESGDLVGEVENSIFMRGFALLKTDPFSITLNRK